MPTLESLTAFIEAHSYLAYAVLFFGAYFETLIGIGFFVHGELFFIPGAIAAGAGVLNVWLLALILFAGGILGDNSSYILGRRYGDQVFKKEAWIFNLKNYKRGKNFFDKHGPRAVFLARFLGPISWVTPFLAGVYRLPYNKFLPYNILGVLGGIGQFIILGYFFGSNYHVILDIVGDNILYILVGGIAILALYYYQKRA